VCSRHVFPMSRLFFSVAQYDMRHSASLPLEGILLVGKRCRGPRRLDREVKSEQRDRRKMPIVFVSEVAVGQRQIRLRDVLTGRCRSS